MDAPTFQLDKKQDRFITTIWIDQLVWSKAIYSLKLTLQDLYHLAKS